MSEDLGWNRMLLSGAVTLQAVGNIVVSPLAGWGLDRHGPKMIMVFGSIVATICFLLMGSITEPWQFYLLYSAATVLGLNELGSLVTSTTVAKWFVRKRGRAMSLASIGLDVACASPTHRVHHWVAGWRQDLGRPSGSSSPAPSFPPRSSFSSVRQRTWAYFPMAIIPGSQPARAGERTAATEQQWKLGDALRNPTTWIIVAAFNTPSSWPHQRCRSTPLRTWKTRACRWLRQARCLAHRISLPSGPSSPGDASRIDSRALLLDH